MEMKEIESIWIIIDPKGKAWQDTARLSARDCKLAFARGWLSPVAEYVDGYLADTMWYAFSKAGYKIQELHIKTDSNPST